MVLVHDGQREQLVALQDARRLLLVGVGGDRDEVGGRDRGDRRIRLRGDQRAQVEHALQPPGRIGDVDIERLLDVGPQRAQPFDDLAGPQVGRDRDPLAGHATAGGILGVLHEHVDGGLLGVGNRLEDERADLLRQLLHDVGGDVVGDPAQDRRDAIRGEPDQEVLAVVRLEVAEHRADLVREARDEQVAQVALDARAGVGELGGVQLAGVRDHARCVVGLEQRDEQPRGLTLGYGRPRGGVLHAHGTPPCSRQ